MSLKNTLRVGLLSLVAVLSTGATVTYYEEGLPMTMNPLFADSMVERRSHELVFDRLYYHNAITNALESRIVERFESVYEGKGIKLFLKEGITWHSGAAMTSKDVCFTVNALLNKRTASHIAEEYREVLQGCKTQGSNVAIIEFRKVFHNPRERLGFRSPAVGVFKYSDLSRPGVCSPARWNGTLQGFDGASGCCFRCILKRPPLPQNIATATAGRGDPIVQVRTLTNNGVQGIVGVPPTYRTEFAATDEVALKSYDLRSGGL